MLYKYKEIEDILNQHEDWDLMDISDDGRRNSQDSEDGICKKINTLIGINKTKTRNREEFDLYLISGEDLKIVLPENFTNTISFTKLAKMLNLSGNNNNSICKSYIKQKSSGQLKLVKDYQIVFLNKENKKFKICSLTELPNSCIAVNPSNGVQTKIPKSLVERTDSEKFDLVHRLFIEYINKRILIPAKNWENAINGE
jgi:hypothetical protein